MAHSRKYRQDSVLGLEPQGHAGNLQKNEPPNVEKKNEQAMREMTGLGHMVNPPPDVHKE